MSSALNRPRSPAAWVLSWSLFGVGVALCLVFLSRMWSWGAVVLAAAGLTGFRIVVDRMRGGGVGVVVLWRTAQLILIAFHVFALYLAVALGGMLGWATSPAVRIVVGLLSIAWISGRWWSRSAPRVPLVLPLGIWIVVCLLGWLREESFLRCDDLARLAPPASLLLATTEEIAACAPGARLPIGRYPRKFWQSPDGRWLRFTTQAGYEYPHPPGRLDGLLCEIDLAGDVARPRCVGGTVGKSHGLTGADTIDKMLFAAWSLPPDDEGRRGGVFLLPETGPAEIEAEHRFDGSVADMIFEPSSRTLHLFCDSNDRVRSVRLPGFERLPDIAAPIFPGEVRYDPERDEGVVCSWLTGAAVRGDPFEYRFFGSQAPSPWSLLGLSWGCDWDPLSRRVYAAIPNLGLLYEIDYDRGTVLRKHWVGFGVRSVTLDRARGLLYLTDFLGGDVIAFDPVGGRERERWFVGRYVREAYLARDGSSLFVSSNLGVVEIPLPGSGSF